MKIYNTTYWKEHCFGLTSASVVEKAAQLRYVGEAFCGSARSAVCSLTSSIGKRATYHA